MDEIWLGSKPQNLMTVQHFSMIFQVSTLSKSAKNPFKNRVEFALFSRSRFGSISDRFWGPKIGPKSIKNRFFGCLGSSRFFDFFEMAQKEGPRGLRGPLNLVLRGPGAPGKGGGGVNIPCPKIIQRDLGSNTPWAKGPAN